MGQADLEAVFNLHYDAYQVQGVESQLFSEIDRVVYRFRLVSRLFFQKFHESVANHFAIRHCSPSLADADSSADSIAPRPSALFRGLGGPSAALRSGPRE